MKDEKLKHIEVYESTHIKAKKQAFKKGMTLRGYINFLIDNREKRNKQVEKDQ